jgi:hypothetical protein
MQRGGETTAIPDAGLSVTPDAAVDAGVADGGVAEAPDAGVKSRDKGKSGKGKKSR